MAESSEAQQNETQLVVVATEDMAIQAVNKRYEGLSTVRAKASKGKGAWYWAYLEPILVRNPDTDDPKAVKLRCNLCEALFSASNPSRTASEHLKRGTCPNFNSLLKHSSLSSSLPPLSSPSSHSNRKRPGSIRTPNEDLSSNYHQQFHHHHHHNHHHQHHHHQHLLLSGGKEDLGPLAMLEDSVKKLKSPKPLPPGPILTKSQIDSALGLLTDWFYESYASASFPSFDHPKFTAFMNQVGLPEISRQDFISSRLDSKYEEAKLESESKIRDAEFYQLSSSGWKIKHASGSGYGEEGNMNMNMNMIKFMVNLPNGTTLFRNTFLPCGAIPATYAEEIMWQTVTGTCNIAQKCVGIVADKYKTKALRNLELQNHWMINLSCQLQGVSDLIKDFSKELPLFNNVISNCLKLSNLFNNNSHARSILTKFDSRFSVSFGVPPFLYSESFQNFSSVIAMLDNIMSCARVLQLVVTDDLYKVLVMEEEEDSLSSLATEVADVVQNMGFWNDVEAINTLVKVVKGMVDEIESERPLVGQCLPLWEDLKSKIKDWCVKFSVPVNLVEKIVEKRFKKNYHPAWSTAFILDPVYLMRDETGKYLPPFKCLTCEQEKDVEKLITRLVSREEEEEDGHKALMELMKWRKEGLDPLYAQAVQVKQRDPLTGKMKMANPQSSRLVWETILKEFTILGKIAVRLLFLHATCSRFKCNWSLWGSQGQFGLERVQKMIFIAAHSKLKRGEFGSEDEKENGDDDDMLDEVFVNGNL